MDAQSLASAASSDTLRRVLVVANPKSGAQHAVPIIHRLIELSAAGRREIVVRYTSPDESAAELVRDAGQFDRVIAVGGDGTVTQIMGGLIGMNTPLAITPGGTGNVLAAALGLSADWQQACVDALNPDCGQRAVDLGVLDERFYFALRFSAGYEAQVTRDTTPELKTRFGKLAYAWYAARHALRLQVARYRFRVDGGRPFRFRAESVWVANTGALGVLGLELNPLIRLDDGQLDLCIFHVSALRNLRSVLRWFFGGRRRGTQLNDWLPPAVLRHVVVKDRVSISASPPQPVQVDGDTVSVTPCLIRVVPRAVTVCVRTAQSKI